MAFRVPRRRSRSGLPVIERRHSRIQGWGVFAAEPISKNTRIVTYDGEKITNRESLKREVQYLKKGHIWCFKLNRLYVRDAAVGGSSGRRSGSLRRATSVVVKSSRTITVRTALVRLNAAAALAARR
jgi:SET domain-containing protein